MSVQAEAARAPTGGITSYQDFLAALLSNRELFFEEVVASAGSCDTAP
jgi:hypothetical protein